MSKDFRNRIELELYLGTSIESAAKEAKKMAAEMDALVQFDFNGAKMSVTKKMTTRYIIDSIHRKLERNSYEYENSIACMRDRTAEKLASLKRDRQDKETISYISTETFDIGDAALYQEWRGECKNYYQTSIFNYADKWARLMQKEMADGKKLSKKLADEASHRADTTDVITGSQYNRAKQLLISCWKFGPELGRVYG
ncbi:MAG: hypothetical protein LBL21_03835 [Rickettsiales bacterium]|jgi:hypothetical protein|nr:hypothetical protein [Rickettsiales bacterium]